MPSSFRPKAILNVFALAMINVAIIASLRGLPLMAKEGLSSILFFILAALFFLLPSSLISAELATTWPQTGGVYVWVCLALGDACGFLAIWLQWLQNVIWYPTVLSFCSATLTYVFFDPELANNKLYTTLTILGVYWTATLINFRGMKVSGHFTSICVLLGTIIPAVFIVVLGIIWLVTGHPSQINFSTHLFSQFSNLGNLVFLGGVLLLFAGMEVSATHAREVKNPQRDYPRAILLAMVIVLAIFILGTLSISVVVPPSHISLIAGLMQGFSSILAAFHLNWVTPLLALLVVIGSMGQVCTWIVGPSKGLFATADNGDLPPMLKYVNKHHVPTHVLLIQGLIVTVLSFMFLLMPNINSSYWILTALTAQLYLVMYVLLYIAAILLRYRFPDRFRPYRVPGRKIGIWFVSLVGLVGSLFCIIMGFIPPVQFHTGGIVFYESFLIGGLLIAVILPFLIHALRKPSWKM